MKKTDFDHKLKDITSHKSELIELSKQVKPVSTKGLTKDLINKFSIVNGAKFLSLGIFQNYLVFIPTKRYIKHYSGTTRIESWKPNRMADESSENITKSNSNFAPVFVGHISLPDMNINGYCFRKNNISILKKLTSYVFFTHWVHN